MKFINAFALFAVIFFSTYATAQMSTKATDNTSDNWILDTKQSRINFVSIKKGNIAESHVFSDIAGHITAGKTLITIKPDSVDSRVPIRNERMREFLFETGVYPNIEIHANVGDTINDLESGDSKLVTLPATIVMHGVSEELDLDIRVSKLNASTLVVSSTQSVLIRAADFNMVEGINKLSSLVNNLAIAETVPVNFSLQLKQN